MRAELTPINMHTRLEYKLFLSSKEIDDMKESADKAWQNQKIIAKHHLFKMDGLLPSLRTKPSAYLKNTYRYGMISLEKKYPAVYNTLTTRGFPTPYTARAKLLD